MSTVEIEVVWIRKKKVELFVYILHIFIYLFLELIMFNRFTDIFPVFFLCVCVCVCVTKMGSKWYRVCFALCKPHIGYIPMSFKFPYNIYSYLAKFLSPIPYHWIYRLFLIWSHYNKLYSEHPYTYSSKNCPDYLR